MTDNNPSADPLGQIADEFVEAFRRGQRPSVEEFAGRYPAHADGIRALLPALELMEVAKSADDTAGQRCQVNASGAAAPLRQLGDYQILREVGRGGMGVVYEAQQLSLGRHVAIKVLPAHALLDPRHLGRFQREARSAARLHHTNIVPVFGVGEQGGLHYYVMQFIQGLGLDVVLDELRRLRQPRGKHAPTLGDAPGRRTPGTREVSAADVARGLLSGESRQSGPADDLTAAPDAASPVASAPGDPAASSSVRAADTSATIRLPGQTEGSTLSESGRQYWQSVARVGVQVADALAHAASQGILHRDIKPSNLLLDDTGNVWVTDFGLAKAASDSDNLTHTGDIVGTLRYMAPERFNGQGDLRSDIYSLGLTLYELLALRPAFDAADRNKLVKQVMHDEPLRPRKLNPAVPRDLETVVLKAIARDPAHRYQTPAEMAADLKRFVEDRPIKARRISEAEKLWRWCRRNKGLAASLSAVALLTVAVAIGSTLAAFYFQRQEQTQKQLAANNRTLADQSEAASRLAERRADEIQQNLYWAEMNLAVQAAEGERGIGRLKELLDHWRPTLAEADRRGWEWYYLRGLGQQALLSWPHRHGRALASLSWHPDNRRLASGGTDGVIRLWDGSTGRILATLRGHAGSTVPALSWSPHGRQLASGSADNTVKLWDADTGREVATLRGHTGAVLAVSWSPDGSRLASAGDGSDQTVKLWDAVAGREIATLRGHTGSILALSWSPDRRQLASASYDGTVRLWDGVTGREMLTLRGDASSLNAVSWSPDGRRLASGGEGRPVTVWDPKTGREIATLRGHTSAVTALAWSPDSRYVASASQDQTLRVWEPDSGRVVANLRGHTLAVLAPDWSRDGRRLASGGWDSSLMVWDMVSGLRTAPLRGHKDAVWCVSWSPDGRGLASSSLDHTVRIWDTVTGRETKTLSGHTNWVEGVSWSPDGRRLASASHDRTVKLWDADTGCEIATLRGHSGAVQAVAWSPDGGRLVSVGADGATKIWAADTGREIVSSSPVGNIIWAVSWSPNGRWVACTVIDGTARVMDADTLREMATLRGTKDLKTLCWSPDSQRLACGGLDHCVRVWDVPAGRETAVLRGHSDWVMGVSWSPDGRRLSSASNDGTVKIWDPDTGQETATLRGHEDRVNTASWSPDGQRLASAGWDRTVRIWDATRGYTAERSPALLPGLERRLAVQPPKAADLELRAEIHARLGQWDQAAADWTQAAHLQGAHAPQPFLAGWWVLGPSAATAPSFADPEVEPDPFQPLGNATPGAPDAARLHWRAATSSTSGALDLGALFPNARAGSARALLRVYALREQPVIALLGSSSSYRFWLNGRLLDDRQSARSQDMDDQRVPLTLRAGWNTLLFHVTIGTENDWLSVALN
jgi:eukaryotic-like serine/threonine-protein kinase